jgi:hypothetical protein
LNGGRTRSRPDVLESVKEWPGNEAARRRADAPAILDRLYVFHVVRRKVATRVHAGHGPIGCYLSRLS